MAKLFTNHDPYHIHKLIGLLCLIHFVLRFGLWVQHGTVFPQKMVEFHTSIPPLDLSNIALNIGCLVMHLLLHATSFLLPVPAKRNFSAPMIWREFRLHNAVFGTRNIFLTMVCLLEDRYLGGQNWMTALLKWAMIMVAMQSADLVTHYFGDPDKRTTNAMPYPKNSPQSLIDQQKSYYMFAQVGATGLCFVDASGTFGSLLGIEMASLLMTLVRKGKIDSKYYHFYYGLSLWINMVFSMLVTPRDFLGFSKISIASLLFCGIFYLRRQRWNKFWLWTAGCGFFSLIPALCSIGTGLAASFSGDANLIGVGWLLVVGYIGKSLHYIGQKLWQISSWPFLDNTPVHEKSNQHLVRSPDGWILSAGTASDSHNSNQVVE